MSDRRVALVVLVVLTPILMASGGYAAPLDLPVHGGTLRVAHSGEPPTIDLHWTSGAPTQDVAIHIFEGLFALSSQYEAKPMLVERWTVSPDRRRYVFVLRRGVPSITGAKWWPTTSWHRCSDGGRSPPAAAISSGTLRA
ncbi:MAG: hypothetical protein A2Z07_01960 [Armatimonadetes bacterium RBG_16_67_12]|nr:MAG: hypothetical protein A2Z07_01960 [Armatimonadetes bacterium RBG_16_67_12]